MGKFFSCLKTASSYHRNEVYTHDGQLERAKTISVYSDVQCHDEQHISRKYEMVYFPITEGTVKETNKQHRKFQSRLTCVTSTPFPEHNSKAIYEGKINALFHKYKDPSEDCILTDGIERLCLDLHLLPDEFKVLVLAWKFNAHQMCQFSREEFVEGCKTINAYSVKVIRERLEEISLNLDCNSDQFKSLYRYTYNFGLDNNNGQRILPVDIAISLWKLVFSIGCPSVLPRWINFLTVNSHIRGIPKDTWNMFINFVEYIGSNFSLYNDAEAWPSIFDEFVDYENDILNQNCVLPNKEQPLMTTD